MDGFDKVVKTTRLFKKKLQKKLLMHEAVLDAYTPFIVLESCISKQVCESILETISDEKFNQSDLNSRYGNVVKTNIRNSFQKVVGLKEDTLWIYQIAEGVVDVVNKKLYRFNLTGFTENMIVLQYTKGGHYNTFHTDLDKGHSSRRKLSFILQLSSKNSYTGGDLEFAGEEVKSASREIGTIVIFPSYVLHKVTPVLAGVRHSLVGWVNGPPFK